MYGGMVNQKEAEKNKESDAVDGERRRSADASGNHQKAAENHKYHTVGHQKKKPKVRLVATLGKGSSNTKTRGPQIQGLFNQGPPENTSTQEERGSVSAGQSQMEVLKQTLQTMYVPDELNWCGEGYKGDVLENSWTDIVHSHKSMPKTQRHQQEALWELLHTECVYIKKLTIITDLVLAALKHVHQQGFLQEVTSAQLFSNITSILDAHRLFWWDVMHPLLQKARLTGQPFDPLKLEPGCLQFAERFSAYLDYCWEEERNLEFTRRQQEINPHFNIFLMWVETHPQCGRMRLADMQAKPHQRITKYPLLLKAILKATQDLHTQQKLNRMINSVGQFLDNINDYLLFKDDELALFAMSQKIEGYELQGMSEEIDKHMQEFCHFDLTSPIRGTGPKVMRKLIMAEPLKVRGRKDSKLEVMMLLFTDVLLLTKTQKKSEKQKVVRPPLSLERIHCAELKDGYSFVLVEVSDLGCPVSVYSVSTPSPDSCAAWIAAIHQAQEALQSLRNMETIEPEEPSDQILEGTDTFPPASIPNMENIEKQLEYKSHSASLRFTDIQLGSEEQNLHNQHLHANFPSVQIHSKDKDLSNEYNTTEKNEGRESSRNGHVDSDILCGPTIERRVTWNHKLQSQKNSNGPHHLLVSELRKSSVSNQTSSSQLLLPNNLAKNALFESAISITQSHSQKPDLWQDSLTSKSGDENEFLSESQTFTRILKSPRLRGKRPINSQPSASLQGSRRMSSEVESLTTFPNSNFKSVPDSNENHNNTSSKTQNHLVLKLGSIKQNQGAFWNIQTERLSESESELTKERKKQNSKKTPKIKTQRSESFPEMKSSTLQGLLNRAKERERERGIAKRHEKHLEKTSFKSSNNVRTTLLSPSEGGKKAAAEERKLFRSTWYVSNTGTETDVDISNNDIKNRSVTPLGINDWLGWCFDEDDEDVLGFTGFEDESEDWFEQTLKAADLRTTPRHSEADYSEV